MPATPVHPGHEPVPALNYHHLQYFWAVAHRGNLTQTARELRLSPSALSAQIRLLEAQLGEALFVREKRGLVLTEAGRIALAHADGIVAGGQELVATLARGRSVGEPLRVGAVATLSRNFQESFLRPLLDEDGAHLHLVSGRLDDLLGQLAALELDLVLANDAAHTRPGHARSLRSRLVARQRVSFISRARRGTFRFPRDAAGAAFLLPGRGSAIREAFDAICARHGLRVQVRAEVDDMALLRLLACDTTAIAVVPPVVVRDELRSRRLRDLGPVPGLREEFYAITVDRRFPHPRLEALLARRVDELLGG
ncbi:MAG: LysR family transcriptional regulator [Sandaracinaceae bacterium]